MPKYTITLKTDLFEYIQRCPHLTVKKALKHAKRECKFNKTIHTIHIRYNGMILKTYNVARTIKLIEKQVVQES